MKRGSTKASQTPYQTGTGIFSCPFLIGHPPRTKRYGGRPRPPKKPPPEQKVIVMDKWQLERLNRAQERARFCRGKAPVDKRCAPVVAGLQPAASLVVQERLSAGRAVQADGIFFWRTRLRILRGRNQRIHDLPGPLDLVAAHEESRVAVQGILDQTLIGIG